MSTQKIGLISDTHGLLRPEVLEALQGADLILHAGDITTQKILDQLEAIAPVCAVRGNNDWEWGDEELPLIRRVSVSGLRILMAHRRSDIPYDLTDVDLVLYGHSHIYDDYEVNGVHFLNPGSCGPRRFHKETTLALLYLEDDFSYRIEKITIPSA